MSKIPLPNSVILDPYGGLAASLTIYARDKGFPNLIGFLAEHPDGSREYVLVDYSGPEGRAIHANQQFETMACYIDMMTADRDIP